MGGGGMGSDVVQMRATQHTYKQNSNCQEALRPHHLCSFLFRLLVKIVYMFIQRTLFGHWAMDLIYNYENDIHLPKLVNVDKSGLWPGRCGEDEASHCVAR